MFLKPAV